MRQAAFFAILFLGCSSPSYADHTIIIQRGDIEHPEQVNDDLVAAYPELKGTWNPNGLFPGVGCFVNPQFSFEYTDDEIRITVPESLSASQVEKIVDDYIPRQTADEKTALLRSSILEKLKSGDVLTDEEASELFR